MTQQGSLVIAARTSLLLVLVLTVQLGVVSRLELLDVQGDLILLVAVCAGLAAGADRGAAVGFAAGISFDLLLQSPFGLSALTYSIVAYVAGSLHDSVLRAAWWIPVATAAIASSLGVILYGVFGTMVGEDLLDSDLLRIALVVGMMNALVAPAFLRVVKWATCTSERARARPVMR